LKAIHEELERSKSQITDEIVFLENEVQEEQSKYSQQQHEGRAIKNRAISK
jgi:hypothetical protein